MAAYTLIGFLAVAAIIAVGVYWVITNLSFKRQPERYTYVTDEAGTEYVRDNTVQTKDEPDAKA
jgi:hypothetical protein